MSSEFNFFQNWYPIFPLEDLEINKPQSFTLLGQRLVIWKGEKQKKFQVFLDLCPHRLAPLSEGRIDEETGNLMCSYHGWQFNEKGICTCIPQAENQELVVKNQHNFAVKVFPTREENDLLWVWADANTPDLAEKKPLPLSPQIDKERGFVWSSMVRDLEYDWQTFIENVADPSHVPFAHHGLQGNRKQAQPIAIEIVKSSVNLIEAKVSRLFTTTITFEPPSRLEYAIGFGDKGQQLGLITYCIPIEPGKCRIVAQFARNFAYSLHKITPRWWEHIKTRNAVLDGDMILLHQQERFLQQKLAGENWKNSYKMPTKADRLVIEFRRWFDIYCEGKLPWEKVGFSNFENLKISDNRQQILNRYSQHTKYCKSCRNALKTNYILQIVSIIYFILSLSITAILPDTYRISWGIYLIITGLISVGFFSWLKFWFEPQFYFVDYIHADRK